MQVLYCVQAVIVLIQDLWYNYQFPLYVQEQLNTIVLVMRYNAFMFYLFLISAHTVQHR